MITRSKYHIMEAETLDARKRHRALIEKALKNSNLSAEMRNDLLFELRQAVMKEYAAQKAVDEEMDDEKRIKGEGGSDGDGQGSSSGSGGGGGFSQDDSNNQGGDDTTDIEIFELLLFLAEHDTSYPLDPDSRFDANADQALGAATLLFDRQEKIALISEAYTLDTGKENTATHQFLPSLEAHAAKLGALALHINVHHDAVDLFRQFGYELQNKSSTKGPGRTSTPLKSMRKALISQIKLTGSEFV